MLILQSKYQDKSNNYGWRSVHNPHMHDFDVEVRSERVLGITRLRLRGPHLGVRLIYSKRTYAFHS